MCQTQMSSLDVTFNVETAKFCPGPCESMTVEPKPYDVENVKKHVFKPYSGGCYDEFVYPMSDGGNLILKNVRMCRGCYDRYQEICNSSFDKEDVSAMSNRDAEAILAKLNNDM